MKKKLSGIFTIFLILIAFFNILFPILKNINIFTERFDPKLYEKKYNNSQYVIPQSRTPISDEVLVSYAGYRYATGMNPILINSDHPPLGKYLIGWITLLTGNNRMSSIVFALGNLILIALIIFILTKSYLIMSLGMFFLSLDSMFIDQIIHSPILDIIQVFFLLLFFCTFLLWLKKDSLLNLVFMGIVLGCMSSIKLYLPVFIILISTTLSILIIKKSLKYIFKFVLITVPIIFIVYTSTYYSFFMHGNSFRSFLGAQKWIFLFWKNNSVQSSNFIGDALTLILFNQWKVWWGNNPYIHFERWTILWPVFFVTGIGTAIYGIYHYFFSKKNSLLTQFTLTISIWVLFATSYLSMLAISPRYIMILFFPIYILIPLVIKLITINLKTQIVNVKSKS